MEGRMKRVVLLAVLLLVITLIGCSTPEATEVPSSPTVVHSTVTPEIPTPTPTPIPPSATPDVNNCPASDQWTPTVKMTAPTKNNIAPDLQFEAKAILKLKSWQLVDYYDAEACPLIIRDGESFRLNPDWNISYIDYASTWLGLASPPFAHKEARITKTGNQYFMAANEISETDVTLFLNSIRNLHPIQNPLGFIGHTDDYPNWSIEIIGRDGRRILITSDSNSGLGAPWNVYYNGRFYAQYDGSLYMPLTKLFNPEFHEILATNVLTDRSQSFSTGELPRQLSSGFLGLSPLSGGLRKYYDSEEEAIVLNFDPDISDATLGKPVTAKLISVTGITSECSIKHVIETNTTTILDNTTTYSFPRWHIICRPPDFTPGNPYNYQMQIIFSKSDEPITGEIWDPGDLNQIVLYPPPTEILEPLLSTPSIQTLFDNNVLYYVEYSSESNSDGTPSSSMEGKLVLAGEIEKAGTPTRYLIQSPFEIQNGQVEEFSLNQEAISEYLPKLINHPFVRNTISLYPDEPMNIAFSFIEGFWRFEIELSCPGSEKYYLPSADVPFIEFNFGYKRYFGGLPVFSDVYEYSSFFLVGDKILGVISEDLPQDVKDRLSRDGVIFCGRVQRLP